MRIGIELTGVPHCGVVEGQAKYAFYLARALLGMAPEVEFTLFYNTFRKGVKKRDLADALGTDRFSLVQTRIPFTDRSDVAMKLKYLRWAHIARRRRLDLFHGTSFLGLPWGRPTVSVVTVHDIAGAFFPFDHIPDPGRYRRRILHAIARAARVLVPSHYTRRDLVTFWNVPEEKISVTPEGFIPPVAAPVDGAAFDLPETYVLYVGSWRINKNVNRLLRAFAKLGQGHADAALVFAGGGGASATEALRNDAASLGILERVRFLGRVSDAALDRCYRGAALLVQPSLYEGFGLTVLEAMGRGCPVACSHAASLPEVAGDGALYFDPLDTDAMADAMARLLADDALRRDCIDRGRKRVDAFTWERTAETTLEAYRQALR